ncbi:MAG: hypothetical protein Q7V05_12790 [Methanoregula sp.]|nr:hypothetical protein [Methanoregula sp.]
MVRIEGIPIEAEYFKSYIPSKIDIFISSIGWEERCPIAWNQIKENKINVERKIIFFYNEVLDKKDPFKGTDCREKNITEFSSMFDLNEKDSKLFVQMLDESTGLKKFQDLLENQYPNISEMSIVFDFSVMVKPYFFILLKLLSIHKKVKKIFLLYTEPKTYVVKKINFEKLDDAYFTKGSNTPPKDMLSFSGCLDSLKADVLVILLGFEGQRAKEVTNEINPDVIIPINGFPSYRPEFKDISILLNDEILKETEISKNLQYAPSNNPFETKNELSSIYQNKKRKYNISIAPLGPKPMALGCCLFVLENPECRVVYPYPQEYNPKASNGYEKTWLFMIEFDYSV